MWSADTTLKGRSTVKELREVDLGREGLVLPVKRIPTIAEMKAVCRQVTRSGKTLGLVPTMGALHEGHMSLVRAAKSRCNIVAASIFVNPLQFGPSEDLAKYPRTLERDCALLEELGVDLVFLPTAVEMYGTTSPTLSPTAGDKGGAPTTQVSVQTKDANPSASSGQALGHPNLGHGVESANVGPEQSSESPTHSQLRRMSGAPESSQSKTYVLVEGLSDRLDGASRPGHFRGVSTVVAKLFEIVRPDCAFFGQKDAAQVAVLRKMVKDLDMDVEVVVCPIVREKDGLAMSSRNVYLSAEQRQQALVLHRALMRVQTMADRGEHDAATLVEIGKQVIAEEPAARLDYFAIVDADTLDAITQIDGSRPSQQKAGTGHPVLDSGCGVRRDDKADRQHSADVIERPPQVKVSQNRVTKLEIGGVIVCSPHL